MAKKGGGILPVAIYNSDIYFLFARETMIPKTKISGQWSDFGGSHEKGETVFETAIREGYEETNNIFKSQEELKKRVKENLITKIEMKGYATFLFEIKYDPDLPKKFKLDYENTLKKYKQKVLEPNGLYEKDRLQWIKLEDLLLNKSQFRKWYVFVLYKIDKFFKNGYKL
jgi:8-oxo-dGTP pyrophosphatase MutT (NUDIX family)